MLNDYYTYITDAIYHAIEDTIPRATHLACPAGMTSCKKNMTWPDSHT